MGEWTPGIPPQLLAAALARRGSVPPAPVPVPPPPAAGAVPLATRSPVTLPQAQAPGPLPMSRAAITTPPAPPIRMGAGGANLAEPGPPGVGASGIPYVPPGSGAPAATPPKPSDDPVVSPEMRKAMQPVQDAQSALDAEQKKVTDLQSQIGALHAPTHAEYKPSLAKRIAAPFIGALIGRNAEPALDQYMNGPYNRAEQDYQSKLTPLQQQLEVERGVNVPIAESRARIAQEGFSNQMAVRREDREQKTADSNQQYKSDLNDIRQMYDEGRVKDAQDKLDETAERNKDNATRANEIITLRQQLLGVQQENADTKAANGANANGLTASEQRDFNAKTRRYNGEIDALNRERAQMVGIDGDFAKKRVAAIDTRLDELHGNIDKAEQDIINARPPARNAHGASGAGATGAAPGFQAPKGAPAPAKEGQILRDKNSKKILAVAVADKSGKLGWGPPQ